ncbi:uncharacterized protein LOC141909929 [Tubulanus polymorphus]|uniref:uncharacterized protein LOC141909929 n=1 Tax=Tubulanus polymorphus TaxID=672921 RepID=UPI003DA259CF
MSGIILLVLVLLLECKGVNIKPGSTICATYGYKSTQLTADCTQHKRKHTNEKLFECLTCEKCFMVKSSFDRHMKQVHDVCPNSHVSSEKVKAGDIKKYKCQFCDKRFSFSATCKRHERIHTGEKPYKCQFCNKGFYYYNDRVGHERIHTGEKPFKCPVCEKCFTQKSYRKQHMKLKHERIHTGEKPFKCAICNKRMNTLYHCKQHERLHTGQKPFKSSEFLDFMIVEADHHHQEFIFQ